MMGRKRKKHAAQDKCKKLAFPDCDNEERKQRKQHAVRAPLCTLETILQLVQQQNTRLRKMVGFLKSNSLRQGGPATLITEQESRFVMGRAHPIVTPSVSSPSPAASRSSREAPLTASLESMEPMVETVSSLPSMGLTFESTGILDVEVEGMEGFSLKEGRPRLHHEVIKVDDRCGLEKIGNQTLRETMSNGGGVNNSMKVPVFKVYTRKGVKERRPSHDANAPKTTVINEKGDGIKESSTSLCRTVQNCQEVLDSINDPSNNLSSRIIPCAIEREAVQVKSRSQRRASHAKFSTKEDAHKLLKGMAQHKVLKDSAPWMFTPKQHERMKKACIKVKANHYVDKRPQVRRKLDLSNEPSHTSRGGTRTYNLRPLGKKHYESDHNGNRGKIMAAMEVDNEEEDIHINKLLDNACEVFKSQTDHFMENLGGIIAPRKLTWWGGTVVTSVVGALLTQNVTDDMSGHVFMKIAAKFCSSRSDGVVVQDSNVPFLIDGSPHRKSDVTNGSAQNGRCLEDLTIAFRSGELGNWNKHDIMELLNKSFERETAKVISEDIDYVINTNTSCWKNLLEEAHERGYKKENDIDAIDWEAVLQAPFADIEECIKERGQQFKMTLRILAFLIRIKRDHGHIDLEWLKYVSPEKARKYLLSIRGLGIKSVNCITLLSLRFGGFPVDTNVSRISIRLGWVPLVPLHSSLKFHEVTKYQPEQIHAYLWPLIDTASIQWQYELHNQLLTFGKTICTPKRPNCGSCPFTAECKYYESMRRSNIAHHDNVKNIKQLLDKGQPKGRSSTQPPNEYVDEVPDIEDTPLQMERTPTTGSNRAHHDNVKNIKQLVDKGRSKGRSSKPPPNEHVDEKQVNEDKPLRMEQTPTTEYIGYIIPDQDIKKFGEFPERSIDDPNPYLFIVHSCDRENAKGTILIPCRTVNKGIFPLNGTYFQENEVFADHSSSHHPIEINTTHYANFDRATIHMGSSITSITEGATQEKIRMIFKGYYCRRGFDLNTRSPHPLCTQLYARKSIGRKSRHESHLITEE